MNQGKNREDLNNNTNRSSKGFLKGLMSFLREYSVLGLAIGLIIGQASKDLVDSIVNGLFMPLIKLIISQKNFDNLSFVVRGVTFQLGTVISSFLTFLIVMTLLYFIVKKIIKNDTLLQKK